MEKTKKITISKVKKSLLAYIMVFPLVLGICVFSIYPPLRGMAMSFFEINKVTDPLDTFIWFDNFVALFGDENFLKSIVAMFTLQVPRFLVNCIVPFVYAELMFCVTNKKLQSAYRILILLPIVCPGIVSSLIWMDIYAYDGGLLNDLFGPNGLGIIEQTNFLGNEHIIGSLIFMGFPWLPGTGALIVLAGLLAIPGEVLEATRLDGCGTFRRVFVIDLSYLIGQIKYVVVFGIIGIFQDYGNQLIFANGNIGTPIDVPAYYMYWMVQKNREVGKASAIGVILFIIIMIITALTYKLLNSKDEENI